MPELIAVPTKDQIDKSVTLVAQKNSSDFHNGKLSLIAALKGAFVFLSDLVRKLTIPVEIDFLGVASCGFNTFSSGKIQSTESLNQWGTI